MDGKKQHSSQIPNGGIDTLLSSNSGSSIQKRIEFVKGTRPDLEWEKLKSKYTPINAQVNKKNEVQTANGKTKKILQEDDLVDPKYSLFPEERISEMMIWSEVRRIGAGLKNLGNTCFMNSVLQCLTYTPPLANYALKEEHSHTCKSSGFCTFCLLEKHIKKCIDTTNTVVSPIDFAKSLHGISKLLKWGRQEDSHEFIRNMVDALQKSCLQGVNMKAAPRAAETTVIHRIFGGHLQSQVQCGSCGYKSNTFDPFLDLSLEIKGCDSVERALQKFTSPEILDKENKYKCPGCGKAVQARKQFTIKRAPNVLTIQLKRFSFHLFGVKVDKHIKFTEKLDLTPYLSKPNRDKTATYSLYAVLVHSGATATSGHYYSYVKSASNIWHCMNDSSVNTVSAKRVLDERAYMLFYIRDKVHKKVETQEVPESVPQKRKLESNESASKKQKVEHSQENGKSNGIQNGKSANGNSASSKLPNGNSSPKVENGRASPKLPNGEHHDIPKISNGTPRPKILDAMEDKGEKVGKSEIDKLFQKKKENNSSQKVQPSRSPSPTLPANGYPVVIKKETNEDAKKVVNSIVKEAPKEENKNSLPPPLEELKASLSYSSESPQDTESPGDSSDIEESNKRPAHPKPKAKVVVQWDESLTAEWKKKQYEKRKEAETAQKSKENIVKALDSFQSGVYGIKTKTWDEKEKPDDNVFWEVALPTIKKPRDEWDEELDKGKTKKVKKAPEEFSSENTFQEFQTQGKKMQEKYGKKFRRIQKAKDPRMRKKSEMFKVYSGFH